MLSSLLLASALTFAPIQSTSEPITETPIVEETPTSESVDETLIEEITAYIEQITKENELLNLVIGLLGGTSALGTLISIIVSFVVNHRNRQTQKSQIKEMNALMKESLDKIYTKVFKEDLAKIIAKEEATQELAKIMIKAFNFAQDKSAQGKNALCDLLLKANEINGNDKDVEKSLIETKTEINKEQAKVEETNKKVENDYIPVD